VYISQGRGSPRHQVLLAAYLLEKLRDDGHIRGCPALDNSFNSDGSPRNLLLFTSESGSVLRFDPHLRALADCMH
jgi:hypothetical protein